MRRNLLALVALALSVPSLAQSGEIKGLTPKDLGSFDRVSDVQASPTDNSAIYDLRSTDLSLIHI